MFSRVTTCFLALVLAVSFAFLPVARADVGGSCIINYIQTNGCGATACMLYIQGEARTRQNSPYAWSPNANIYFWSGGGWSYCGSGALSDIGAFFFPFGASTGSLGFTKGHTYTFQARCYVVNTSTGQQVLEVRSPSFAYAVPGS